MVSVDGETTADSAADSAAESAADSDGLSLEQEDALNKIMAEIEGNEGASTENSRNEPTDDANAHTDADTGAGADVDGEAETKASPSDDPSASDDEADSEEGLSPEQEDALNKIMAEIEGDEGPSTENPGNEPAVDTNAPADTAATAATDADGEAEAKAVPSENPSASDDEADSEEGLSPEQEDALNKIMAEIEGNEGSSTENPGNEAAVDTNANAPADADAVAITDAGGEAAKTSTSDDPSASDEKVDSDEGLSREQEEALNKILAEIDGYEEADAKTSASDGDGADASMTDETADGADDTEDPPSDESAPEEAADAEAGLNSEQEEALNKIMAEIEGQSGSPKEKVSPSETAETEAEGAPKTPEAQTAGTSDAGEAPSFEAQSERSEAAASNEAPPSPEDLLSQIQAAAQGSEEELAVSTTSKDASENKRPPQEPAAPTATNSRKVTSSPEAPPPPLAEIKDQAPAKKRAAVKPKGSISKKFVKTAVWTGLAVAVVAMMAMGTYYWLSRGEAAHTATAPPASEHIDSTIAPTDPLLADEGWADEALTDGDLPPGSETLAASADAPQVCPESERLEALSERIRTHRTEMLAKAREIEDLSTYYASGIEGLTQELVARIKERQITDFKSAQKDTAISMGLDTIQRRAGYIEKLALPRRQILAAAEELRYLARKADILGMIAAKSSGLNLDPFSKQVDEVLERLSQGVSELSLDENASAGPALKKIWENVWAAHMKAPKKEPPATLAMRRNKEIWKAICGGDFTRVGELSALSGDAAVCLAAWEGKDLFLNNLEQLTPEAAKGLTGWGGEWLVLNGLKSLSPDAARHLASWKGERLSLNGLTDLSPAATRSLAKWQGRQIEMIGLRRLDDWDNPQVTLYVRSEVRDNLIPQ